MKSRRLTEMESYILAQGSVTMEELCEKFQVSMNTVRRDVAELVKPGLIQKVYGGVKAENNSNALIPYAVRSSTPNPAKEAICQLAGQMVKDQDIIFIDSGTTTAHIVEAIKDKNVTVITNNLEVMTQALKYENIRLIVLPGEIHRKTHSITGEESASFLSHLNTNIAFMAATGASLTGVTNSSPLEYSIKKTAVAHTQAAVLLVTGNKFGVTSLYSYATLDQFQAVITDSTLPDAYKEKLEQMQITLRIANA